MKQLNKADLKTPDKAVSATKTRERLPRDESEEIKFESLLRRMLNIPQDINTL